MPYEWHDTAPEDSGAVSHRLRVWPHRSLPARGFVWFISLTAGFLTLPLLAVLGTMVLWAILPFVALAIWAIWLALQRSYRSGNTLEELTLDRDRLELVRHDPGRQSRRWQANSHWVRVSLREGPVEDYLTLSDGQREVELGAFLSPEERRALHDELRHRLHSLR
ncbi:DUF2244 domain-containing protein [Paracoccus marinaquae]|uniref:DUF2244 domain-containing protein n=1 Tax=Paracoccus marinaquae TaxID=2841926 RepID=A0ABS6AFW7_9RHOB|nr:DUF2244 domain-containing protein [Paracoccus marinaquae]MBU3029488.1 DUF2244 domain-containing protein [Paracoccus marinaquae]